MISNQRPIRALFLNRDLPYHGGVPNVFLHFGQHRNPNRIHLTIGSLSPASREMTDAFARLNVPVLEISGTHYLGAIFRLRHDLREQRIQVILSGSLRAYIIAKLATLGLQCRIIFRIAGIPLVIEGRLKRLLYRSLARHDTLIFNSKAVQYAHDYSTHMGRSYVIYNCVNDPVDGSVKPYEKRYRPKLKIPLDSKVIGYIAEFVEWKDHATLLTAFDRLADDCKELHLILIGTGNLYQPLTEKAQALRSRRRIHFLGPRSDARRLLGLMDLYVHPSRGEGFGLAVVEAMLAGIPVVAARAGSLPELIIPEETGWLFEPGNAEDLAAEIIVALQDKRHRQQVVRKARKYSLQAFAPKRFVDELTSILEIDTRIR
jgi:glycosyltransferase involved in cell wall biosynthesis